MKYLQIFERFYRPTTEIKLKLDTVVRDLRKKYHGGKDFFDALDASIKDISNEEMILALLKGNKSEWIISSGEFGDNIWKLWKMGKFQCKGMIVFNGKMQTYDIGVESWYPKEFDLNDKEFIYVDDSLFSGSTSRKIDDFLKKYNSKIKSISVIYDGSKIKNKMVRSFFRYFDNNID